MAAEGTSEKVLDGKVCIVGSGFVGRSYAMLFAGAGYDVTLYDVIPAQISAALADIREQLKKLEKSGLLRGKTDAETQAKLVKGGENLEKAVTGAVFVLECAPERLDMKVSIFTKLDCLVSDRTILASSTSCITMSQISEKLKHRQNCIVTHPVNPPYYVPLVELVPAPWTRPEVTATTRRLMEELGQAPVVLNREVDGFALNRMQYALINECWNLVQEGIMSREDVDTVMTHGLGRRYAFMGPLLTTHLNANGIDEYCEKYGAGIHRVSSAFSPPPKLSPQSAKETGISASLFAEVPEDGIREKIAWRDERLALLAKLKRDLNDK